MSKTAIIYWSGTGNTEVMANAIFEVQKRLMQIQNYFQSTK